MTRNILKRKKKSDFRSRKNSHVVSFSPCFFRNQNFPTNFFHFFSSSPIVNRQLTGTLTSTDQQTAMFKARPKYIPFKFFVSEHRAYWNDNNWHAFYFIFCSLFFLFLFSLFYLFSFSFSFKISCFFSFSSSLCPFSSWKYIYMIYSLVPLLEA